MKTFVSFLRDEESGAAMVEYALVLAGVAVASLIALNGLGADISAKFEAISTALTP